ncbi:phosphoadenosine phosphosulfate reductase [Sulfitobacter sp. JB4-11]|uniref:phosphoadenosine phosphosulfate reductase n=1 Tax=Sulfitobacter rhodophyticola TaxID=3238304 RepID=UPI003D816466
MKDQTPTLDTSFADMPRTKWLSAVASVAEEDGFFQTLGPNHFAAFAEDTSTLLVTFETMQGIHALSDLAQPLGWEMLKAHHWSHLCVGSDGDTWFRDEAVYAFFDRLVDDGFFDEFDTVIFYGAGPCAYAAAAFSVTAPGAHVVAIQPQATLDPRMTEWDPRFMPMRAADFTSRYGYAPDMLDAAASAHVLYDPREQLDAMHAALFTRSNVTKHRMRFMGDALQTDLLEMNEWANLLLAVADEGLTPLTFARLYRTRRDHYTYLRGLLSVLEAEGRDRLAASLCRNVTTRMNAPKFTKRLAEIEARLAEHA